MKEATAARDKAERLRMQRWYEAELRRRTDEYAQLDRAAECERAWITSGGIVSLLRARGCLAGGLGLRSRGNFLLPQRRKFLLQLLKPLDGVYLAG